MKEIKRTIAALLASLMMMSSVSVSFGAETMTADQALVVAKVGAAGIMQGTDLGFEGEKTLTRAEAAAIMVRMKGIDESVVKASAGETLFSDVAASHWAAGYINVASSQGIIKGVGAGNFAPDTVVTVAEFTTMSVRALGAGTLVDSMGTWPTNYMNFANEEKLTEDVYKIYTAPAARIDAATIAANTLEADVWEKRQVTNTNEVTYQKQSGKTILSDTLEIVKHENVRIKDISTKDREITVYTLDEDDNEDVILTNVDVADGVELATLKDGISYDVWYDANSKVKEVVGIWKAEDAKEKTEFFTEIVDFDAYDKKITLMINGEEEEFDCELTKMTFNGEADKDLTEADMNVKGEVTFGTALIEGSNVTAIYAERFNTQMVVKEIKNDVIYFESTSDVRGTTNQETIDLDGEDNEFAVLKDGKEIKATDIEEGDALYFYKEGTKDFKYSILVNNASVSGVVSSVSAGSYVKIDGKKFDLSLAFKAAAGSITPGDEIKAYINSKGEVAMIEKLEGAAGDLAVVTSLRSVTNKYSKVAIEMELTQLDGTVLPIKEIDLDESLEKIYGTSATSTNVATMVEDITGDSTAPTAGEAGVDIVLAEATTVDDTDTSVLNASILGRVIRYNDTKDGYVIEELHDTLDYPTDKDDAIVDFSTLSYNDDNMKLGNYRLTSSTKVLVVETTDKGYARKVKSVNVEDLGTPAAATLAGYVMGIDENTDKVDTVVFTSEVARSTENNYAVVVDTADIKSDDYDLEISLLLMDGTEVTLKSESPDDATDFNKGNVIEYSMEDDTLTDYELVEDSANTDDLTTGTDPDGVETQLGYVMVDNGDSLKVKLGGNVSVIDIAEDAIYYSVDEEGDIAVAKAGDIKQLPDSGDVTGATICEFVMIESTEVNADFKIVAVKIAKGDKALASIAADAVDADAAVLTSVADGDSLTEIKAAFTAQAIAGAESDVVVTSDAAGTTVATGNEVTITVTYTAASGLDFGDFTTYVGIVNSAPTVATVVVSGGEGKTLVATYTYTVA